ncbi:hypothetical protein N2152v2_000437 [Parachlorella kessleri]
MASDALGSQGGSGEGGLSLDEELAILWTLVCAIFVVFMQCGFALLESGAVRQKNVKNILLKNALDACVSTVCWWAAGYAFAYGSCGQSGFIGYSHFFSSDSPSADSTYWSAFFFSWAFSATATTVVSGAVAERMQFKAYVIYTGLISAFIYPLVVHWGCGEAGYAPLLSRTNGLMDFAGSGVVHMVGGGAGLMGAILLGPRLGRFQEDGSLVHFEPSSPTSMAVGVFILWIGWYGFNAGSTGCFRGCMGVASKVAVNTTLSVGSSALTSLFLAVVLGQPGDIAPLLNGILAGAVSITAGCAFVKAYAAFVIGIVAAVVYTFSSKLLLRLRIDDPLDASPIHLFCGMWGILSVGFFATEASTESVYHYANDWGVFYGGKGYQLGAQVLGVVVITAWTCGISGMLFWGLKKVSGGTCIVAKGRVGWLRVPKEVEVQGLDFAQSLTGSLFSKYGAASHWAYDTTLPAFPDANKSTGSAASGKVERSAGSATGIGGVARVSGGVARVSGAASQASGRTSVTNGGQQGANARLSIDMARQSSAGGAVAPVPRVSGALAGRASMGSRLPPGTPRGLSRVSGSVQGGVPGRSYTVSPPGDHSWDI